MIVAKSACRSNEGLLSVGSSRWNGPRRVARRLPRLLRFLMVGGVGLAANIVLFTIILMQGAHPLLAGFLALAVATVFVFGAAVGALLSYNGHRLFAFAPLKPYSGALHS